MPGPKKGTEKKDARSQVLFCLAENGPLNRYQIQIKTTLQYSSIFQAVDRLLSERNLKCLKTLKSQKNVRTSLFGLTFKGFIIYLSKSPKLREVQPSSSFEETENQIKTRHRQETTALSEETKKLTENIESNGTFLDYPIFKEIRWLVQRHRSIIWEILETARFIGVHPPFTLDAVSLIEQTEAEIKRLEIEKTMLDNQVIQRAFRKDQPDNLFELNERKLGYAKQNLINLSQLENELWRRDFTKYFAYRCQYLVGIKNMRNDRLAVFFKQAAEKGKLEVDPAEKMANLFSGLNILKDPK